MPDIHVTEVDQMITKKWSWSCTCGKHDNGYPDRRRAVNAGHLHRTMEMLKGIK